MVFFRWAKEAARYASFAEKAVVLRKRVTRLSLNFPS